MTEDDAGTISVLTIAAGGAEGGGEEGPRLHAHLVRPPASSVPTAPRKGLVLCHGYPAAPRGASKPGATYPEFSERLAAETGWVVLTFNFRGTGASEGDFSMGGWLDDLRVAVDHLTGLDEVGGVWLAGFSTGGALALCAAGEDERVRGVASVSAPADFSAWADDPDAFFELCRSLGVVRTKGYPANPAAWVRELREVRPAALIAKIPPRPLLLVHGANDEVVPVAAARLLAEAAGGDAELRVLAGGGHRLRHDPRAVALLLGWMDRQQF